MLSSELQFSFAITKLFHLKQFAIYSTYNFQLADCDDISPYTAGYY